ncbi:MAG TPA: CPBP family intramembrane metalloprotease [Anaerolineae bacterium]|nr:CPBP family intramembrane metalloprotease [Anaerolineae bacterium]HQH39491.1 CPBP family intramembrane metalloprotease [Anaerolineae bacterium]
MSEYDARETFTTNLYTSTLTESCVSSPRRETPSLLAANLYLLVGLGVLIWGSSLPDIGVRYVVGIAVECVLAVGALFFMRLEKLSVRETLRWRWPGWQPLLLSGGLACGLWFIGIIINLMATVALGYTTPLPPTTFPRDGREAFLLVLSTVVVAPLCEEIMFRGYVQRAYERRSPWIGIVVGGIIFALYHLRFQGAFALVPVAFTLGCVAWRSDSLFPGILLHAAYNSIASVVMIASSFSSAAVVSGVIMAFVCIGLFMVPVALVALWRLWRITAPPVRMALPGPLGWRKWAWMVPLVVMLGIYGYSAFGEVVVGRFPETLAVEKLTLQPPAAWDIPTRWYYSIQGGINQTVGTATCELTPQADSIELACRVHQDAFKADLPFEVPAGLDVSALLGFSLAGEAGESTQHVGWAKTDLTLQSLTGTRQTNHARLTLAHITVGGTPTLQVERAGVTETATLPAEILVDGEWPWRLSALPFAMTYGSTQPLALVSAEGHIQIVPAFVLVTGSEPSWTPAGNFITWKVTVTCEMDGQETTLTAWYDVEAPHTLVRYDNGEVSYLLERIE